MALSEWLAMGINLLIAVYLIHYYPAMQKKAFRDVAIPRLFVLMRRASQGIGYMVMVFSLGYIGFALTG